MNEKQSTECRKIVAGAQNSSDRLPSTSCLGVAPNSGQQDRCVNFVHCTMGTVHVNNDRDMPGMTDTGGRKKQVRAKKSRKVA